jgi:predicted MFS family arabinose efflux permease
LKKLPHDIFQIGNRQSKIPMTHRQLKIGYFTLAGMNTVATSYYFNYLFFFLRDQFGFGNRGNLWVTALSGFIYIFAAWQCGKFAARFGRVLSLKIGFASLCAVMIGGALAAHSVAAQLVVVSLYNVVLLLTWPALEALVSERETQSGVQEMVGIYNCTWAAAAALAYFTGGKLYDLLGAGAVFWLPAGIFCAQFLLLLWLEKHHAAVLAATPEPPKENVHAPESSALNQPVNPQAFLKMAWLANPFAYVAINTLFAVMPGVAEKLALSPTRVGLFCSVWLFGRLAAFALLWRWRGWHYRFRWLLAAFLILIAGLATILLAQQLWLVVVAQIFFGLATGLIYYSSLFYSMDVGEASSEHGGLHEAFIGAGIFLGPATGAAALTFAPQFANAATWAVSGLLVLGLGGLFWLRKSAK